MPRARDAEGNIWEVDAQGNVIGLVRPAAAPQPSTTIAPNPARAAQANAAAQTAVATAPYQVQQAQAQAQRAAAEAPYAGTTAAANAREAVANARKAEAAAAAASKEQANAPNPEAARIQQALKTSSLLDAINAARRQIGAGYSAGNFFGAGGWQGVPVLGQGSADLSATISGIQGAIINDTLAQLKAQSANGASGYGSLTESEAQRLAAAVAALQQTQSPQALLEGLARAERHYRNTLALSQGKDPRDPAVAREFGLVAPMGSDIPNGTSGGGNGGASPPGGNPPSDGTGGGLTSQGRFERDPGLTGVNAQVRSMIQGGRSTEEIRSYLNNVRPGLGDQVNNLEEAVNYGRQNPGAKDWLNVDVEKVWKPAEGVPRVLGDIGMSPAGSAVIGAGDFLSAGLLDNLTGDPEMSRAVMGGLQEMNPNAYAIGQVAGGVAGGMGLEGLAAARGVGSLASARIADSLLGAAYGAGSADGSGESRIADALLGGAAGFAGGALGRGAVNVAGRGLTGVRDGAQRVLNDLGVQMTPGQLLGGRLKAVEDRLSGLPFIGDAINARRTDGVQSFNRAAMDEALAPVSGTTGGAISEPGMQVAQDAVSQAYRDALGGQQFQTDLPFKQAVGTLSPQVAAIPRVGPELQASMTAVADPMFGPGGTLTGEGAQDVLQGMQTVASGYRGGAFTPSDPLYATHISPVIDSYVSALEDMIERQSPGTIAALRAANAANRNVSTVGDAVIAAKNQGGEFMPSQLMNASAANTKAFSGKRSAAAGRGPLFDIARAGQEVLPNKIPDSGTAGRLVIPALVGGAAGGGDYASGDGSAAERGGSALGTATVAALLASAPYSAAARNAFQRAMMAERPLALTRAGEVLLDHSGFAAKPATVAAILAAQN